MRTLTMKDFKEKTDPEYGEDWLVFETEDLDYRLAGYYYNPSGYRIEVTTPDDRLIITHNFTEEDSIRDYDPEAKPWMNLWWDLYNSSLYVR